jgi:hypothetical protein
MAAAVNGVIPADQVRPPPTASPPHLLERLLAGEGFDDLPPLHDIDISDLTPELSATDRAAVALALGTADVALLQSAPGADVYPLVKVISAAGTRHGERLLLIFPNSPSTKTEASAPSSAPPPMGIVSRVVHLMSRLFGRPRDTIDSPNPPDRNIDVQREPFDRLVVVGADEFSDDALLAVARRARRWVLIGAAGRGGFARLWANLHCDLWDREGDRVICRLKRVPPDCRDRLDREPVADRPDIELRIHTPAGGEPELAEVAFPAGTTTVQAMEYLFLQLGEIPPALGRGPGRTIRLDCSATGV